jgi:uncharacterized protein
LQVGIAQELANRGDATAQSELAYRLAQGLGMQENPEQAFQAFEGAAARGEPHAIFNVGVSHLKGHGTPQNATRAKEYIAAAREMGILAAYDALALLYYNGHGVPENKTRARCSLCSLLCPRLSELYAGMVPTALCSCTAHFP